MCNLVFVVCFHCVSQGHRQEVIGSLKDVVQDMMKEFYRRNGKKPEAIIYYRDGVADSQFPIVLEYEYTAFRQVRGALLTLPCMLGHPAA